MNNTIAVFGASSSAPGDGHYESALRCGSLLAEAGFTVATGGYGGTMEAVSRGASEAGGEVVGVTAPTVFPDRRGPNDHITIERPVATLVDRIGLLTNDTAGAIVLWGSLGTAAEMIVAWNLAYVAPFAQERPKPIIAVGAPWLGLVPHLESELDTTSELVTIVEDVDAAVIALSERLNR